MRNAPRDPADRRPRPRRGSSKPAVAAGWGRGPLPRAAAAPNPLRRAGRRSTDSSGWEEEEAAEPAGCRFWREEAKDPVIRGGKTAPGAQAWIGLPGPGCQSNKARACFVHQTSPKIYRRSAVLIGVVVPVFPHRVPATSTASTIFGDWV